MIKKFVRKLIEVEIRLGFLHIPAAGIEMMPEKDGKIAVNIDGKEKRLTYNAKHKRVFGLVRRYKSNNTRVGDEVVFAKNGSRFELSFKDKSQETPLKEAETLLDISGLSTQARGDIVEDRVKEFRFAGAGAFKRLSAGYGYSRGRSGCDQSRHVPADFFANQRAV
jgi:hypothetical protein